METSNDGSDVSDSVLEVLSRMERGPENRVQQKLFSSFYPWILVLRMR